MKKLSRFKKLLVSVLFLVTTLQNKGQIICTDVNPDLVSTGNSTVDIDMNNDAAPDFRLTGAQISTLGFIIVQAGQIGTTNSVLTNGSGDALALPLNAVISSTNTTWTQMNGTNQQMILLNGTSVTGPWAGATDLYLGLKFIVGTNTYYGWARFSFTTNSTTYTFKDYAYNASPGQPILAGQGCGSLASPAFALPSNLCVGNSATLVANTGTATATTYNWIASPAGPVFSNSTAATTTVSFSTAGTYSIALVVTSGTAFGFTQNTVTISALPSFTLVPSSASICLNTQLNLTANGASGTTYTFVAQPTLVLPSGSNSAIHSPSLLPQTYTVIANKSGCIVSNTITINEKKLHPTLNVTPGLVCAGMPVTLTAGGVGGTPATSYTFMTMNPSIVLLSSPGSPVAPHAPFLNTVYTVLVDSAGCKGALPSPTVEVQIRPAINVLVTSSQTMVCAGTSVFMNASGVAHPGSIAFIWTQISGSSSGSLSVGPPPSHAAVAIPATSSVYSVNAVDSLGCVGSSSINIIVNPAIGFPITVSASSLFICAGQSATLSATTSSLVGSVNYTWTPNPLTGTMVTVTPNVTTNYTVTGSNAYGCVSSTQVAVTVGCIGIDEPVSRTTKLYLYPNPAGDRVYIHSPILLQDRVELLDVSGKRLAAQLKITEPLSGIYEVPLNGIPAGLYLLQVTLPEGDTQRMRFIKEGN